MCLSLNTHTNILIELRKLSVNPILTRFIQVVYVGCFIMIIVNVHYIGNPKTSKFVPPFPFQTYVIAYGFATI